MSSGRTGSTSWNRPTTMELPTLMLVDDVTVADPPLPALRASRTWYASTRATAGCRFVAGGCRSSGPRLWSRPVGGHRAAVASPVSAASWYRLRLAQAVTCAGPGSRSRLPLLQRRPARTSFSCVDAVADPQDEVVGLWSAAERVVAVKAAAALQGRDAVSQRVGRKNPVCPNRWRCRFSSALATPLISATILVQCSSAKGRGSAGRAAGVRHPRREADRWRVRGARGGVPGG